MEKTPTRMSVNVLDSDSENETQEGNALHKNLQYDAVSDNEGKITISYTQVIKSF